MDTTDRGLRPGPLRILLALLTLCLVGLGACQAYGHGEPASTPPPYDTAANGLNVIIFLVDDMDDFSCQETKRFLPRSSKWLLANGRCFQNASVSSPVCCPSRAVLHSSQLPHNNGVRRQLDAKAFRVDESLQRTLSMAGMTTYGTGKHFNGVKAWEYESGKRPSGFDSSDFWPGAKAYGYKLWNDQLDKPVKPAEDVHATVRSGSFLRSFVTRMNAEESPFYAYVGFKAVHTDNSADTEKGRLPRATPQNSHRAVPPLDWDPEADTSDKLPIFQAELRGKPYFARLHRARVRALYDIDDQVDRTFRLLTETGLLATTAVIFTSDNGYHLGQNGWETKGDPYRSAIDVPLLAYHPPAFGTGVVDRRDVGLIDVGPTVYELLDVEPVHRLDGHSLLDGRGRPGGSFYEYFRDDSLVARREAGRAPGLVPNWAMYRQGNRSYIQFYDRRGSIIRHEFYADRWQKRNLLHPSHAEDRPRERVLRKFRQRLAEARTCAGTREAGAARPCP